MGLAAAAAATMFLRRDSEGEGFHLAAESVRLKRRNAAPNHRRLLKRKEDTDVQGEANRDNTSELNFSFFIM